MNELLQSLKSYIILSLQDLTNIKNSIGTKYAHLSSSERAEILAMAIHTHLDKHLIGIDDQHKETMRLNILEATLAKHIYYISRHDVFEAIFELDINESAKVGLAETWLVETVQIPVPRWALEDYLYNKMHVPRRNLMPKKKPLFHLSNRFNYEVFNHWMQRNLLKIAITALIIFSFISILNWIDQPNQKATPSSIVKFESKDMLDYDLVLLHSDTKFEYESFDYFKIKYYISITRDGLIGDSNHFNQIIHKAYINNIDPLLLFAIIGQEQSFVPNSEIEQAKIINNPYNVFHSWQAYNTNLRDSTQIAINTIKNRLASKPYGISPFQWLGQTYAEDIAWPVGVESIYEQLVSIGR